MTSPTKRRATANVLVDGEAARTRRQDLGLTQRALAEQLGCDQGYLSQIEANAGRRRVGPALFRRMCDALGMTPDQLRAEKVAV